MQVVIHDLDIVLYELDEYVHGNEATAQCPYCQETNRQTDNQCVCGAVVVWKHSPTWKKLYGKPDDYLRALNGEDLKPITPLEVQIVEAFGNRYGLPRFQNVTQQRQFRHLARKYPAAYLTQLMDWARDKGWVAFVSAVENTDNYTKWLSEGQTTKGAF